jgi:hypothetical protein
MSAVKPSDHYFYCYYRSYLPLHDPTPMTLLPRFKRNRSRTVHNNNNNMFLLIIIDDSSVEKISLYDAHAPDTVPAHPVTEGCACAPAVALVRIGAPWRTGGGGGGTRHLPHATHAIGVGLKKGSGGRRRRAQSNDDDDNSNNNIPSSTLNAEHTRQYYTSTLLFTSSDSRRSSVVWCFTYFSLLK